MNDLLKKKDLILSLLDIISFYSSRSIFHIGINLLLKIVKLYMLESPLPKKYCWYGPELPASVSCEFCCLDSFYKLSFSLKFFNNSFLIPAKFSELHVVLEIKLSLCFLFNKIHLQEMKIIWCPRAACSQWFTNR